MSRDNPSDADSSSTDPSDDDVTELRQPLEEAPTQLHPTTPLPDPAGSAAEPLDLPAISGYQIEKLLGEGGMARVYLARDTSLNRPVAIKVMSRALADNTDFIGRFEEEGQIIASFRHPNVVTVHASGAVGEYRYIVQEFVSGGDLETVLSKGALPPKLAYRVARQMASALQYSHDRDIIHRDFKPANILFTDDRTAVLSDFGIARSLSQHSNRTAVGSVIGSLRYMAPEQLRGEQVNEKVDVYAWGLVFYQMLTGHLPSDDLKVIHHDEQIEQLQRTLPAKSRHTAALLAQCLRASPAARPSARQCFETLTKQRSDALGDNQASRPWGRLASAAALTVCIAAIVWWRVGVEDFIEVTPNSAVIWQAGEQYLGRMPRSDLHTDLIVVGDGYFGEIVESAELDGQGDTIELDPWHYPAEQEFERITEALGPDAPPGVLRQLEARHPTYARLLALNLALATADIPAFNRELEAVQRLASAGDAAAKLVLFLAADMRLLELQAPSPAAYLQQSSEQGFALATFYLALKTRAEEETMRGGTDRLALTRFKSTMERAAAQGLDFAELWVRQAQAALARE